MFVTISEQSTSKKTARQIAIKIAEKYSLERGSCKMKTFYKGKGFCLADSQQDIDLLRVSVEAWSGAVCLFADLLEELNKLEITLSPFKSSNQTDNFKIISGVEFEKQDLFCSLEGLDPQDPSFEYKKNQIRLQVYKENAEIARTLIQEDGGSVRCFYARSPCYTMDGTGLIFDIKDLYSDSILD